MRRMHWNPTLGVRSIKVVLPALMLGSCSYAYDVRAVAINGRLAFISTEGDYDCLANISVSTDQDARPTPVTGDDRLLIQNGGAFWWTDNPVIDCMMEYPLFYGAPNPGVQNSVAPKKLFTGVIYNINTEGDGAYGFGCFRISKQRKIENLDQDRCLELKPSMTEPVNGAE